MPRSPPSSPTDASRSTLPAIPVPAAPSPFTDGLPQCLLRRRSARPNPHPSASPTSPRHRLCRDPGAFSAERKDAGTPPFATATSPRCCPSPISSSSCAPPLPHFCSSSPLLHSLTMPPLLAMPARRRLSPTSSFLSLISSLPHPPPPFIRFPRSAPPAWNKTSSSRRANHEPLNELTILFVCCSTSVIISLFVTANYKGESGHETNLNRAVTRFLNFSYIRSKSANDNCIRAMIKVLSRFRSFMGWNSKMDKPRYR